jgi:hypothetical protein
VGRPLGRLGLARLLVLCGRSRLRIGLRHVDHLVRRTPLNFPPDVLFATIRPLLVLRFTWSPVRGFFDCERLRTAPRRPGPFGGFVAIVL